MKILLLTLLFTSCSGVKFRYATEEKPVKKTVIQKLAECTERYFSEHGVDPSTAFDICEKIYRQGK